MLMESRVKLTHILLETAIIFMSCLVFFPLSKNTEHFNQNCLLNSNIFVKRHSNHSVSLDLTNTVFGDIDDCNYTTFFNVVVAMHGMIWIWFFLHLDALTSKDGSHVNILLPALVTHIVIFICAIVCSIKIGDGFSVWCQKIEDNNRLPSFRLSCKDYQSLSWTLERSCFYSYNEIALVSSWIMTVFILVSMAMTCIHLYWDFLATLDNTNQDKSAVETSGFVDNGVGILNKMALTYSQEGFYTDSMESDYDGGRGSGGGGASQGIGAVGGGGDYVSYQGYSNTVSDDVISPAGMIVNATVHTAGDSDNEEEVGGGGEAEVSGLRNRGNVVT